MQITPRAAWNARAPEAVTPRAPSTWLGVVVHWFGSPRAAKTHAGCPALLRAVQNAHMAGEYKDIAYGHAVCPHGVVYELRGFGVQVGANGNARVNREYGAIVAMIGKGDKPTPVLLATLAELIALYRLKGAGRAVRTHGSITGSKCPGPELTAWVNAKNYEPKPAPPPPPHEPVPAPAPVRVDVDAGTVLLRRQNPDAPAFQKRLTRLMKSTPLVTIRRSQP